MITHAFFKALLFLGAGSVIHAMSDEQDIRTMGGLAKKAALDPWTFLVGYARDRGHSAVRRVLLEGRDPLDAASRAGTTVCGWSGLIGAFLTAFYMFRLYILTFHGQSRVSHEAEHHLHESPRSMTGVLAVLAGLSVVGGLVGPPMQAGGNLFERWLAPVMESGHAVAHHEVSQSTEWMLILLSVGIAAVRHRDGVPRLSGGAGARDRTAASASSRCRTALFNKYWIDELYDALVVRPWTASASGCGASGTRRSWTAP